MRNGILHTTYSIVARDPETGDFGAAVQTHQMCVGPHVLWLDAGVGAVATQSLTNLHFGPIGLSMLREGVPADRVIAALSASDKDADLRQMAVVDRNGISSAWTGKRCIASAGHHIGEGYSVQANLMAKGTVVAAMSQAYESAQGDLAQRMLAALEAAQSEGGDLRGMQSAALKVVPGNVQISGMRAVEVIYDLRVDEHAAPLEELERLVRLSRAGNLSEEGTRQVAGGAVASGLKLWEQARQLAPELEELPFWQGLTLADDGGDAAGGAAILKFMLDQDPRREFWLDLISRVEKSGLLERKGAAEELLAALQA